MAMHATSTHCGNQLAADCHLMHSSGHKKTVHHKACSLSRKPLWSESYIKVCIDLGGLHSTMDSILAMHPAAPGSIPGVPKVFSKTFFQEGKICLDEKIVNVSRVNQRHCCLEQWTAEA